jgi:hypothetical protein
MLAGDLELPTFLFDLLEQASVMDSDRRLCGKGLKESRGFAREGTRPPATHHQSSNHFIQM